MKIYDYDWRAQSTTAYEGPIEVSGQLTIPGRGTRTGYGSGETIEQADTAAMRSAWNQFSVGIRLPKPPSEASNARPAPARPAAVEEGDVCVGAPPPEVHDAQYDAPARPVSDSGQQNVRSGMDMAWDRLMHHPAWPVDNRKKPEEFDRCASAAIANLIGQKVPSISVLTQDDLDTAYDELANCSVAQAEFRERVKRLYGNDIRKHIEYVRLALVDETVTYDRMRWKQWKHVLNALDETIRKQEQLALPEAAGPEPVTA